MTWHFDGKRKSDEISLMNAFYTALGKGDINESKVDMRNFRVFSIIPRKYAQDYT